MISKKESIKFLFIINLLIKLAKLNVFLFFLFDVFIHLRVLYHGLSLMSIYFIILSYVPNAISFYICIFWSYQHSNYSFLIFFVGCFFTLKSVKSITKRNLLISRKKINKLTKLNLKAFNDLLKIFNSNQKFIDLHFTPFYLAMLIIW